MNFDAIATAWAPRLLSILRIMAGLLLLQHGTGKYLKFPRRRADHGQPEPRHCQASPASSS